MQQPESSASNTPAGGPADSRIEALLTHAIEPVADRLGVHFAAAGQELWLVGGSVRDALLGRAGNDLDFTTSARPDQIEKLVREFCAGVKGAAVWDIGKEFGTIGCRYPERRGDVVIDWQIEITTYRADTYRSDSRKPEVAFGDTLDGDLVRRDFTINAMAISVPDHRFADPHRGLVDLSVGVLRTPAEPERSFSDDPLRMMRAARFTSQLTGLTRPTAVAGVQDTVFPIPDRFAPAPEVVKAMIEMADRIDIISAERVRDELSKLLLTAAPRPGLNLLVETGIADRVLPELPALRLELDEHHRHKDVYEHSLTVLEQAIDLEAARGHEPDLVNRLAALLHDIGKPATRKFEEGNKVSFHHHDVVGAKLARKRLKALRFSSDQVKAVTLLVELHLRFHGYGNGEWTDSAVRRYVRDAGEQLERLHILTRADCTTRNQRKAARLRAAYDHLEERIAKLTEAEELNSMRPDLNGDQIMAILGIKPGREVGVAYRHLLELRIENGPLGEEAATEELKRWWAEQQG